MIISSQSSVGDLFVKQCFNIMLLERFGTVLFMRHFCNSNADTLHECGWALLGSEFLLYNSIVVNYFVCFVIIIICMHIMWSFKYAQKVAEARVESRSHTHTHRGQLPYPHC